LDGGVSLHLKYFFQSVEKGEGERKGVGFIKLTPITTLKVLVFWVLVSTKASFGRAPSGFGKTTPSPIAVL
jgi:hypothetical protein